MTLTQEPTHNVKHKCLILPGHAINSEGALSQCAVAEHEANLYKSQILQRLLLNDFNVNIFDPVDNDLKADAAATKGYDIVIAEHCNAFDKARNYACVCVSNRYSKPTDDHVKIASKLAVAIGEALKIKVYNGPVYPPGVMPADLYVLHAAHKNGVKWAWLIEPFFIDSYCNSDTIMRCCDYSMNAVANVLRKEFLGKKNWRK